MEFDFAIVHRPGIYHQAADTMSKLSSEKVEKELGSINEDTATLDLPHFEKIRAAPVMCLSQESAPMFTSAEMIEAQTRDPCNRSVPTMVEIDPVWLYNEHGLLRRKSAVERSVQIIVPQEYRAAILNHAH